MDKNEHENKEIEIRAAAFHKKMDSSKFIYHHKDIDTCLKDLGTDRMAGLSSAEAARKLEKCGPNELDKEEEKTLWERIKEQFEDQLVQILLASATITFVLALMDNGDEGLAVFVEPFVILTILVLNAVVAIWQDHFSQLRARGLNTARLIVIAHRSNKSRRISVFHEHRSSDKK